MSKFNANQVAAHREQSYEGGLNYSKKPVEEWINFLFSSYAENGYYESTEKQIARYSDLTKKVADEYGWEFVAKASFFARNYLGMRSISQITAAMINDVQIEGKRAYFRNFFHRPDDVAEVFSIIENMGSKKRSHALIRGASDYLSSLNAYSIGKYKMNGKQYNMYDLINLTHANSTAINDYKNDCLDKVDTWEVAISTAAPEKKSEEWIRLVESHRLGYLALIRNLRNIISCNGIDTNWLERWVCPQLEDKWAIKNSLVFPYQIYQAYRSVPSVLCIQNSLEKAFRHACENVPRLDGDVAVLLDVSGSMSDPISEKSNISIKEVGAVFAAMLYVKNPSLTFIKFGSHAKVCKYSSPLLINIFSLIDKMCENDNLGYGTQIDSAFAELTKTKKAHDLIFIISDMQVMEPRSWYSGIQDFNSYIKAFNPNCSCYSFDLGNYHSQVANPNNPNVHLLTALNEKIFDFIRLLESKESDIVDYINDNYNYC